MLDKKIIFCATNKDMMEVWPHPKAASRVIPDEYKKLQRFQNNNYHAPTVKTCMPFLDSLTMGYIIPFDQDYLVDPIEDDFTVTPANQEQNDFGFHNRTQLPDEWRKTTGENAGKFMNNFPFILLKRDEQFIIKKGEPMVQVIPFKRESWKMWSGFYKEKLHGKVINLLQSQWIDKYKKMFWSKKSFK